MNMAWYFEGRDEQLQKLEKEKKAEEAAKAQENRQAVGVEEAAVVEDIKQEAKRTKIKSWKDVKVAAIKKEAAKREEEMLHDPIKKMDIMISEFGSKIWHASRQFKMTNCSVRKTKQFKTMT